MTEERMTIPEYADHCRQSCDRLAQGHETVRCGEKYEHDGETVWAFCGWHWGAVLGGRGEV